MWPFRHKPVEVPCCAEAVRIQNALDVIDAAIESERTLEPEYWNQELIDFGLDVIEALSRPSITGRS